MAFRIVAEEKQYLRDEGYNPDHRDAAINLSTFDKWAMSQRVKQSNRRWFSAQILKVIPGIAVGLFIAKALNG